MGLSTNKLTPPARRIASGDVVDGFLDVVFGSPNSGLLGNAARGKTDTGNKREGHKRGRPGKDGNDANKHRAAGANGRAGSDGLVALVADIGNQTNRCWLIGYIDGGHMNLPEFAETASSPGTSDPTPNLTDNVPSFLGDHDAIVAHTGLEPVFGGEPGDRVLTRHVMSGNGGTARPHDTGTDDPINQTRLRRNPGLMFGQCRRYRHWMQTNLAGDLGDRRRSQLDLTGYGLILADLHRPPEYEFGALWVEAAGRHRSRTPSSPTVRPGVSPMRSTASTTPGMNDERS
jgi:hypothetical protein